MIRRLVVLAGSVLVARRLLRRRAGAGERVAVGTADGVTHVLEPGTPGREALVVEAGRALLP